ncbi:hypothetical protein, partial [Helicobacter marmotae]
ESASDSHRDSSPAMQAQNDKLSYPQGKPTHNKHLQGKLVWHHEGGQSGGEESLLDCQKFSKFVILRALCPKNLSYLLETFFQKH